MQWHRYKKYYLFFIFFLLRILFLPKKIVYAESPEKLHFLFIYPYI